MERALNKLTLAACMIAASTISASVSLAANAEDYAKEIGHLAVPAGDQNPAHHLNVMRIHIAAPPDAVWQGLHDERKKDKDIVYSKTISQSGDDAVVEQKFKFGSLFGSVSGTIRLNETACKRIDYKLVDSEDFDAWEGSWNLIPSADGQATTLELKSYIDLDSPVPKAIINSIMQMRMQHMMATIKSIAEHRAAIAAKESTVIQ